MRDDVDEALDRRSRILDGARAAFMRFGFERSSIADIATGAGVSRTAVYHYFPGKEDVLAAVVEEFNAATLRAAAESADKSRSLEEALKGLLEAKFGRTLMLMPQSPHGVELVDATHRLTGPANQAADAAFHALVVGALIRHGRAQEADEVADTLIAAAKGLMRSGEIPVEAGKFQARRGALRNSHPELNWASSMARFSAQGQGTVPMYVVFDPSGPVILTSNLSPEVMT
jgi:AcrR family transcriptional regulator